MQGYPGAETNLGDMYLSGRGGLDQNDLEALSWYLKAANQNWPDAQYRLGYMYETGLGTAKDVQRAVSLYRSAAEGGYPDAQNLLGVLYATGSDGLPHDDNLAVDWYRKAAEQGFAKAEKISATCISSTAASTSGVTDRRSAGTKKPLISNLLTHSSGWDSCMRKGWELRKAIRMLSRSISRPPATGASMRNTRSTGLTLRSAQASR